MGIYATPVELRADIGISEQDLDDAAAEALLARAEDRVDDLLGARAIDDATGRKVIVAELQTWQALKLRRATSIVAELLRADPGALEPVRYARVKGPEFEKSDPQAGGISPAARVAFRDAATRLDEAGLRVLTARATA